VTLEKIERIVETMCSNYEPGQYQKYKFTFGRFSTEVFISVNPDADQTMRITGMFGNRKDPKEVAKLLHDFIENALRMEREMRQ
jgi:hypothetical protein